MIIETNQPLTPLEKRSLKMKLGRRAAYLRRCIEVVELLEKHETEISIRCRVFENHIKPIIKRSYQTFNNMLNEPNPYKQLGEIKAKITELDKDDNKELVSVESVPAVKDTDDWY